MLQTGTLPTFQWCFSPCFERQTTLKVLCHFTNTVNLNQLKKDNINTFWLIDLMENPYTSSLSP